MSELITNKPPVTPGEKPEVNRKKITVTVDTTVIDILQYNDAGHDLFFVDDVENFKLLDREEMNKLSSANRDRYRISLGLYKLNCEERANPSPTDNLSTYGRQVAPRSRCHIDPSTKLTGYKYSMVAPNGVAAARANGAEICTKETDPQLVYTNMSESKEGILQAGFPGKVEHIIVRYKKEDYHNNVELPPAKKSQERCQVAEKETANEMRKNGGNSLTLKELAGKKFKAVGY